MKEELIFFPAFVMNSRIIICRPQEPLYCTEDETVKMDSKQQNKAILTIKDNKRKEKNQ